MDAHPITKPRPPVGRLVAAALVVPPIAFLLGAGGSTWLLLSWRPEHDATAQIGGSIAGAVLAAFVGLVPVWTAYVVVVLLNGTGALTRRVARRVLAAMAGLVAGLVVLLFAGQSQWAPEAIGWGAGTLVWSVAIGWLSGLPLWDREADLRDALAAETAQPPALWPAPQGRPQR